jgi:hypothetical protein
MTRPEPEVSGWSGKEYTDEEIKARFEYEDLMEVRNKSCYEAFKKDYSEESRNMTVYGGWQYILFGGEDIGYCRMYTCPLIRGEKRANTYTKDKKDCTEATEKYYDFYLTSTTTPTCKSSRTTMCVSDNIY